MLISTINSIEVSSACDNACEYCPCSEQYKYRKVGLMDFDTFEAAIKWALYFARKGSQREINLFGVGEPTLHPDLVAMVAYARKTLPFKQVLHLNTNGNRMTADLARDLKEAGIDQIDITGHNHYATAKTIRIFQQVGIRFSVSYDFALHPNDWAGQVDWFSADYNLGDCPWISRGQVMVMSDGNIVSCCIDAFAKNVIGNIRNDNIDQIEVTPSDLCGRCHHRVPQERILHAVR